MRKKIIDNTHLATISPIYAKICGDVEEYFAEKSSGRGDDIAVYMASNFNVSPLVFKGALLELELKGIINILSINHPLSPLGVPDTSDIISSVRYLSEIEASKLARSLQKGLVLCFDDYRLFRMDCPHRKVTLKEGKLPLTLLTGMFEKSDVNHRVEIKGIVKLSSKFRSLVKNWSDQFDVAPSVVREIIKLDGRFIDVKHGSIRRISE